MVKILRTLSLCVLITIAASLHIQLDYNNQQTWGGVCQTGTSQSPINIPPTSNLCSHISFVISSPQTTISVPPFKKQNHHLTVPYTGSTLTISNKVTSTSKTYNSLQFHFHIPPEHQLNGKSYDAQLHLVHASSEKGLAVFGIMLEVTEGNFADFLDGWDIGSPNQSQVTLPALSTPAHVYHYQGSLTTPLCGEGVQWFVSSETQRVKKANFQKLKAVLNGGKPSNRNVQGLNGRQLFDVGTACVLAK